MKLHWILCAAILLIGIYVPCKGSILSAHLQDFIDNFVDVDKFKQQGIQSLNSTAFKHIWDFFKAKFHRQYSSTDEEKQRIQIFRDHLKSVLQSNLQEGITFKLGMNHLSDLTKEEFLQFSTGLVPPTDSQVINDNENNQESIGRRLTELDDDQYEFTRLKRSLHRRRHKNERFFADWFWFNNNGNTTTSSTPNTNGFDWRTQKVVTSIKDQGQCGACYAFASVAVMESLYAIKTKSQNPTDFSPQQLVDCSGSSGNNGCNGGLFQPSVKYFTGQGGKIATLASYPYTAKQGTCRTSGINQVNLGTIQYTNINQGDEKGLADALVKYGPMFIGLHVSDNAFMFYRSGVVKINNCLNGRGDMQHALTLVGYGYDNSLNLPYWIIKNSWGTNWGESGYVRLAKDAGNMCGVTTLASWATLS